MLPQLVQHLLNGLYVLFSSALGVDENVIEVYYHENIELLCQDLVDVTLKRDRHIGQSKRHDLIFEMDIAGPEGRLPLIAFPDPHSMVDISQIKLDETSSPT